MCQGLFWFIRVRTIIKKSKIKSLTHRFCVLAWGGDRQKIIKISKICGMLDGNSGKDRNKTKEIGSVGGPHAILDIGIRKHC